MLHNPTFYQVLIQGLIIGIAFTLRYTAIYYPLVALAGLLLSKHPKAFKVWGFLLGIAFIVPFYLYTQTKTKEQTGTAEFSVFGGWQLANNALYMYDHINVDTNRLPPETKSLDRMSRQFWQKVHPSWQELSALPGTYFIKVPYAILKPYMAENSPSYYDPVGQFKAWGKVSPIYKQYGSYLISHHPIQFLRYYLLLNTKNYFLPHLEKFDCYNLEINTVPPIVQDWFDFITPEVNSVSPTLPAKIFYIFPLVFLVLNVYFAGFILWVLSKKRYEQLNPLFRSSLLFATIFLLVNFGFSVFATPVVLRYEIIPMIILISFLLLLLELPTKINQLKPLKTTNA
jgi:hypothetical protein